MRKVGVLHPICNDLLTLMEELVCLPQYLIGMS